MKIWSKIFANKNIDDKAMKQAMFDAVKSIESAHQEISEQHKKFDQNRERILQNRAELKEKMRNGSLYKK